MKYRSTLALSHLNLAVIELVNLRAEMITPPCCFQNQWHSCPPAPPPPHDCHCISSLSVMFTCCSSSSLFFFSDLLRAFSRMARSSLFRPECSMFIIMTERTWCKYAGSPCVYFVWFLLRMIWLSSLPPSSFPKAACSWLMSVMRIMRILMKTNSSDGEKKVGLNQHIQLREGSKKKIDFF